MMAAYHRTVSQRHSVEKCLCEPSRSSIVPSVTRESEQITPSEIGTRSMYEAYGPNLDTKGLKLALNETNMASGVLTVSGNRHSHLQYQVPYAAVAIRDPLWSSLGKARAHTRRYWGPTRGQGIKEVPEPLGGDGFPFGHSQRSPFADSLWGYSNRKSSFPVVESSCICSSQHP
jgi:hypothetical protein